VDPYLVRSAGGDVTLEKGIAVADPQSPETGDSRFSVFNHSHAEPVCRAPPDGGIDATRSIFYPAVHKGKVLFPDFPQPELVLEVLQYFLFPGDHEQP